MAAYCAAVEVYLDKNTAYGSASSVPRWIPDACRAQLVVTSAARADSARNEPLRRTMVIGSAGATLAELYELQGTSRRITAAPQDTTGGSYL